MAVQCYTSYIGEGTDHDASNSIRANVRPEGGKRRRRRHQRRARQQRRNVVSFSEAKEDGDVDSTSSSSSDEDEVVQESELEEQEEHLDAPGEMTVALNDVADISRGPRGRPSLAASMSFAEESFIAKVDRMSEELDKMVKYIRRALDVLAGGSAEISSTFGVLSFLLEEWDM
jgi:gamma-tubulin complex component 5